MGSLLETLSEQADIVVVDTPPLLSVSDAVPLLEKVRHGSRRQGRRRAETPCSGCAR